MITLSTPDVDELTRAVSALQDWQEEGARMQLHPGDLGWAWRFGAAATAAAVRTWSRDGQILAVGFLDGSRLLRITTAPEARQDEELAGQVVADVSWADRGVLPAGAGDIEAPADAVLQDLLAEDGWSLGEPWTPLRRDLTEPVQTPDVRIEIVGPERAADRVAVQRASFQGSTFTEERWRTMAAGPFYRDARCVVAYDEHGSAAGAVTVWSAGPGRPGLVEPMGVHPDQRGRGYGRAVTVAGAAVLQELGSSSALVATPTSNVGGVATYVAAGFVARPEIHDRCREAA